MSAIAEPGSTSRVVALGSRPSTRSAVLTLGLAFIVTAVAGAIWSVLLGLNLSLDPAVPWSVPAMGVVLWVGWGIAGGRWGRSRADHERRRRELRANRLPGPILVWAVAAGLLAVVALAGTWLALDQLGLVPARELPDYAAYPPLTVGLVLMMASTVGAVTEEAMYRGYAQGTLERVVRAPVAIAVVCLVMAPEHALTQGLAPATVLFYLAVDGMLGLIASIADSIVPGIAVHAAGLLVFFSVVWPLTGARQPLGASGAVLVLDVACVLVCAAAAVLAFRALRSAVGRERPEVSAAAPGNIS